MSVVTMKPASPTPLLLWLYKAQPVALPSGSTFELPLKGVLGHWRLDGTFWSRRVLGTPNVSYGCLVWDVLVEDDEGWITTYKTKQWSGPETGEAGMLLADEAARAAGWWLL